MNVGDIPKALALASDVLRITVVLRVFRAFEVGLDDY